MKKIVIAPDSFKGSMTAPEVCEIVASRAKIRFPHADIVTLPIADGGEGTAECFLLAAGEAGKKVSVRVKNPFFEDMEAYFVLINGGKTAIVEAAVCAGLTLAEGRENPARTTTYGVGQLIESALGRGAEEIVAALGGSCTNDGGCGCAAALGVEFSDSDGNTFIPTGATLSRISAINTRNLDPRLKNVKITVMCDVDNPLYGETGAAYIYGPQKGADSDMIRMLDTGLRHLAEKIRLSLSTDISALKGAGAAGGLGGGMSAFFGASLRPGIDSVLDALNFDRIISDASLIIAGEGRIDSQTVRGKAVAGIARRAKTAGVPLIVLAGNIGAGAELTYPLGVTAIVSVNRASLPFDSARLRCREDLALTVTDVMNIIASAKNN